MPSRKKGRAGRAQAEAPEAVENEPSAPSSSSGSKAVSSSAPPSTSSATARLIEGIGKSSPSRPALSSSGPLRDAAAAPGAGGATGSGAGENRPSPTSASSTAAAARLEPEFQEPLPAFEEPSADEFQDALEELAQTSDHQDEAADDPMSKLLDKEPSLQMPSSSKTSWEVEIETLRRLSGDSSVTDEDKIHALHDAFKLRVDDLIKLEEHRTATQSKMEELKRERERCLKELTMATNSKGKLEDTCRELQQMKSTITVESKKVVEDEKGRVTELNSKFDGAMKDVEEKMQAESEVREHFIKENDDLREKLNKFRETYEEQERQISEQNATRLSEMQAARDRLKEYQVKSVESAANATSLEKKNKVLKKTNEQLKIELQTILAKFDEFHESVNGSSKKHGECKDEMDELSAQLKVLDEENAALKSNKRVEELTKEKEAAQRQRDALERLVGNLEKEIADARAKAQ